VHSFVIVAAAYFVCSTTTRFLTSNAAPRVPSMINKVLLYCRSITLPLQHNNATLIVLTVATSPSDPARSIRRFFIAQQHPLFAAQ